MSRLIKQPSVLFVGPANSEILSSFVWSEFSEEFNSVESIEDGRRCVEESEVNVVIVDRLLDKARSFSLFLQQRGIAFVLVASSVEQDILGRKADIFDDIITPLPESWHLAYKLRLILQRLLDFGKIKTMLDVQKQQITATSSNALLLDRISQLTKEFNTFDTDSIFEMCVQQVASVFSAKNATIYTLDEEQKTLVVQHSSKAECTQEMTIGQKDDDLLATICDGSDAVFVTNMHDYLKQQAKNSSSFFEEIASDTCIIAPIHSSERMEALLVLSDKVDDSVFTEINDKGAIDILSSVIGSSILNCRLYQETRRQARYDGLTGLLNHRIFLEELSREMKRAGRYSLDLSMIICDIDFFKKFNDTYGHQAGDHVLRRVAMIIEEQIRSDLDICARYGGEEFVVILPETPLNGATVVAERVRRAMQKSEFLYDGNTMSVTMSLGVAEYNVGQSFTEFIEQADNCLYRAKDNGRNQVQF